VRTRRRSVFRAAYALALSFFLWASSGTCAAQFSFAAFGDTPYNAAEELQLDSMIDEMNRQPLAFVLHVGDIKHSRTECSDALFESRRAAFSKSQHPFILIPGDNEWTDCPRAARPRQALERLAKLREVCFPTGSTLGERVLRLEQQKGRGYLEHTRWVVENVVFATFNVPGPDNHVSHMPEESRRRTAAVIEWMDDAFRIARDRKLPAVVLAMHGNPWAGRAGYDAILAALPAHARRFDGEILVIHGDTHWFRFDRPLAGRNIHNVRRLEVFGSPLAAWALVDVTIENGRASFAARPGGERASSAQPATADR
jgi:hypothetical protein